jgi:hypothetical protein
MKLIKIGIVLIFLEDIIEIQSKTGINFIYQKR